MFNEQQEIEALKKELVSLTRLTFLAVAVSILTLLATTLRFEVLKNSLRTNSLRAKQVTIIDDDQRPRIILGGVDNNFAIIFQDPAGTTRLGLGVLKEPSGQSLVTVSLRDAMGRVRVWLSVLPEGTPVIAAQDEAGRPVFKVP